MAWQGGQVADRLVPLPLQTVFGTLHVIASWQSDPSRLEVSVSLDEVLSDFVITIVVSLLEQAK